MKPSEVMQALYDAEITVRTEPNGCWDNGFRAQIGDQQNGWEEPVIYGGTWEELMTNLAEHVAAKDPNGWFGKRWRGLEIDLPGSAQNGAFAYPCLPD
jgi:hypothetical protein